MSETSEYHSALDKALEGRRIEDVQKSEQFPLMLKTIGNLQAKMNQRFDELESEMNRRFLAFGARMGRLETRMNWWCGLNTLGVAAIIVKRCSSSCRNSLLFSRKYQ